MRATKYFLIGLCLLPIGIILYFWVISSGGMLFRPGGAPYTAIGRLCGLLGVYFILIQFLLRARIQPLEKYIGFMHIDWIHKKNAYVAITLLVLHPIFLVIGYSLTAGKSLWDQYLLFLFHYDDVLKADLGLLLFIIVVCSSIYIARKKLPYHWWYFIHLSTYLAIFLAFGHQLTNGEDLIAYPLFGYFWYVLYAVVFGSMFYWKIFRVAKMYAEQQFYVSKIVPESYDTVSLYIKGKDIAKISYRAGQFAFIRILSKELWWDVHPFSISCAPNREYIRFTIKGSGDFTKKIPQVPINTPVLLDLPHGEFTLDEARTGKLLFIAGGVGLTPLRAMLEEAGNKYSSALIFANKSDADIILKSELEKISVENNVPIIHVMSNQPDYPGKKGYVTIDLLKEVVPDYAERDIFICGPPIMMKLVIGALKADGIPEERIHSEEFSL